MSWLRKNSSAVRVLAVMPRDSDAQTLSQIAARAQWELHFSSSFESALDLARRERFAVILYDRGDGWRDAIGKLCHTAPDSNVILTSPANDDLLWQEVIKLGGYDVLTKPFHEERVLRSIQFAAANVK